MNWLKVFAFELLVSSIVPTSSGMTFQLTVTDSGNTVPVSQPAGQSTLTDSGAVFHNGGTGDCNGCHTTPPQLLGSDPSSTCLRCHQAPPGLTQPYGQYVSTDASSTAICGQLTPGGDFCWIKKNYTWSQGQTSPGERHGHNIVALDYGYIADARLNSAPGGTYPSSALSCISCHDPHGNYRRFADGTIGTSGLPIIASGSYSDSPAPSSSGAVGVYRLLAGNGYQPNSLAGDHAFVIDPPAAVSPPTYNRAEAYSDTRVAYGSGMSEWCQNCHPQMNSSNMHPIGTSATMSQDITNNYNTYIASGNSNGISNSSYTSIVPFELRTNDYSVLKSVANNDGSVRTGPTGTANVMCLSCHRAHASGWDSMTRWNLQTDFIVYNGDYPGTDNGAPTEYAQGRTTAETQKTFYDRPATSYALFQRSLCNKCHSKD
jgi:hypothetical protein